LALGIEQLTGGHTDMPRRKTSAAVTESTTPLPVTTSRGPALNRATLICRLTRDPQLRHTKSGRAVSTLRVAVNDGPEPTFHDVVVWGRTAEVVCEYMRKGRLIHVEGRIQLRSWTAKDGSERRNAEIVARRVQFLGRGSASAEEGEVAP
jgi:single-strand DNA-binding protein